MDEGLTLPIHYQAADLRDGQKAVPRGKVWRALASLFGGFAAIWLAVAIWWLSEWARPLSRAHQTANPLSVWMKAAMNFGIGSLGIVGFAAFFGVLVWHSRSNAMTRILARLKSDDSRTLRISQAGVALQSRRDETQYAWSCVLKTHARGGVILIALRDDSALLIPMRGLPDAVPAQLREWVSRHAGQDRPPGPLSRDAGNLFWQGEVRYTREDVALAAARPPKTRDALAPAKTPPQPPSEKPPQKPNPLKFSRSFFGWFLILATTVLLFAVFDQPRPLPPGAPVPADQHRPVMMLVASAIAVLMWLVAWFKLYSELQWRRNRDDLTMPRQIALGESGIVIDSAQSREWHAWAGIVDVEESADGIVLVSAEEWRLVVPLRDLDHEKRRALADFARARMGGKALGFEVVEFTERSNNNM